MTLSLVFVIIDAVDIDYSLVILARVALDLNHVLIGSRLDRSLAVSPAIDNQGLLLLTHARVLGDLVLLEHLVLAGRVCQHALMHELRR